jgi:hypothetical protein
MLPSQPKFSFALKKKGKTEEYHVSLAPSKHVALHPTVNCTQPHPRDMRFKN